MFKFNVGDLVELVMPAKYQLQDYEDWNYFIVARYNYDGVALYELGQNHLPADKRRNHLIPESDLKKAKRL